MQRDCLLSLCEGLASTWSLLALKARFGNSLQSLGPVLDYPRGVSEPCAKKKFYRSLCGYLAIYLTHTGFQSKVWGWSIHSPHPLHDCRRGLQRLRFKDLSIWPSIQPILTSRSRSWKTSPESWCCARLPARPIMAFLLRTARFLGVEIWLFSWNALALRLRSWEPLQKVGPVLDD